MNPRFLQNDPKESNREGARVGFYSIHFDSNTSFRSLFQNIKLYISILFLLSQRFPSGAFFFFKKLSKLYRKNKCQVLFQSNDPVKINQQVEMVFSKIDVCMTARHCFVIFVSEPFSAHLDVNKYYLCFQRYTCRLTSK